MSCGSDYVLRQNPINSNQSFQLCNKVLRRWGFATEMWHCFSLNNEAIIATVNQCQTAASKDNPSLSDISSFYWNTSNTGQKYTEKIKIEILQWMHSAMRKIFT